jgi:Flp pilus assembly protein TadD
MNVRIRAVAILSLSITLSFTGCSAQENQAETSTAASGCQIDAMSKCIAMRKTFSRTSADVIRELIIPIPGEPTINIHCGINTSDQSVSYARVSQPPNLTDNDVIFLRSRGYCS